MVDQIRRKLLKAGAAAAPNRVVAAVPAQPVGFRPELPNALYESQTTGWAAPLVKRRPEITNEMADQFLTRMFRTNADFVFTVTRDFVKGILSSSRSRGRSCLAGSNTRANTTANW